MKGYQMKRSWRKEEKDVYLPKNIEIKTLPKMNYVSIDGFGNPNHVLFQKHITALYAISYAIKMGLKKNDQFDFDDYTVYPLEGYWGLTKKGIELSNEKDIKDLKDHFKYQLSIRQPDFVDEDIFHTYLAITKDKKKLPELNDVVFRKSNSIKVCQSIHVGPYDTKPETFVKMEQFLQAQGLHRKSKNHYEIYLSDQRKTDPAKLKTLLRVKVGE